MHVQSCCLPIQHIAFLHSRCRRRRVPKIYVSETKLHYLVIPGKRNLITEYGPMIGHLKSFLVRK